MTQTDLLLLAQQYVADKVLVVVAVLLLLGYFLKRTPRVQDWKIPWALIIVGVSMACWFLGAVNAVNAMQGILAAGVATLTHQLWKQTKDKRKDDSQ